MSKDSEAYMRGLDAGMCGDLDSDNPYQIGTDEAMDWEDGRTANFLLFDI